MAARASKSQSERSRRQPGIRERRAVLFLVRFAEALRWTGVSMTLFRAAIWPFSRDRTLRLRVHVEYAGHTIKPLDCPSEDTRFAWLSVPFDGATLAEFAAVSPDVSVRRDVTHAMLVWVDGKPAGRWMFCVRGSFLDDRGCVVAPWARGRRLMQALLFQAAQQAAAERIVVRVSLHNRPSHRGMAGSGLTPGRILVSGVRPGARRPLRTWGVALRVKQPERLQDLVCGYSSEPLSPVR